MVREWTVMKMPKPTLENLDAGQLELMWNFLKLRNKNSCTKSDVRELKKYLDYIRQLIIQKGGGQPDNSNTKSYYINFDDLGTYINLAVLSALTLYIYGGLDVLENCLPEEEEEEKEK